MKKILKVKLDRQCQCKNPVPILHQIKEYWYCMICERKIGGGENNE